MPQFVVCEQASSPNFKLIGSGGESEPDSGDKIVGNPCGFEEAIADRANLCAELFPEPVTRDKAKKILRRALELVDNQVRRTRFGCDRDNIDRDARNLVQFLVGTPWDDSSTEDDDSGSSSENSTFYEPECPRDIFVGGTQRRVSLETIIKIVELADVKHQKESTIKGKYPWYTRQYLPRFREITASGGSRRDRYDIIDREVFARAENAIRSGLPLHEYMLHHWAIEAADELQVDDFVASRHWVHDFKKRHDIVSRKVTG